MKRHLLTPAEAAERLGISVADLNGQHRNGSGPDHIAITAKIIRYLPEDLDRWQTDNNR